MQTDDNASLEQRLTTLEVKLIDLEFAIARMQSGRAETPADSPNQKPSHSTSRRHKRQKSSGNHSPPSSHNSSPAEEQPPIPSTTAERPLSTSTIKPSISDIHRARALQAPSMVSLNSDSGAISVQQYSALVMLLRREQTARRNLEQQVSGMREDIERLNLMARDSVGIGTGTMYPIRSFESQEYLRLRPDDSSPGSSPRQTQTQLVAEEKITSLSRYKSDSDSDYSRVSETPRTVNVNASPSVPAKDERFRPWPSTRRVEVANM
ncbi:uncharacterized protein BDV14DRAFT_173779, partial [Aspergillus stella-maris]|uniref:uncharacterized protein n=1 Tax=Aspergillus stella-maris TaxID=1810926 RepID=UPI003CCD576B